MFGIGTLINTAAVILGGIIGILLRKGLKENIRKTLMAACGVATIFIGVAGTILATTKDENNLCVVRQIQFLIEFEKSQKIKN